MSVKENYILPKRRIASKKEANKTNNSLLDVIKTSSLTADGRKVVENWSRHWKSSYYGKRTGKPVSIFHDIKNLFPSSSSSNSDYSECKSEKKTNVLNASYIDERTNCVDDVVDDHDLTLTKSKSIKRKLNFSEKKDNSNHEMQSSNFNNYRKLSFDNQQKNSTVITVNNEISNPNMTKDFEDFLAEEQSACDNQFLCISSRSRHDDLNKVQSNESVKTISENSILSQKIFQHKKNTKHYKDNIYQTKDFDKSSNTYSKINKCHDSETLIKVSGKTKKRTNNSPISNKSSRKIFKSNEDSDDDQTKGLRMWLTKTVSSEDANFSADGPVCNKTNLKQNARQSEIQTMSVNAVKTKLVVVLEDIAKKKTVELCDFSKGKKQLLFDVNTSNITNINCEGGPDSSKSGPPMSTPRQLVSLSKKLSNFESAKGDVKQRFSADTKLSTEQQSDESVELKSEKPSLTVHNEDTYAESQPVFVFKDESLNSKESKTPTTIMPHNKKSQITKGKPKKDAMKQRKELESKNTNRKKSLSKTSLKPTSSKSSNFKSSTTQQNNRSKKIGANVKRLKKQPSLFERRFELMSPPELIVRQPSPDAIKRGLRRSKRPRVRPLLAWLGEKLVYDENQHLMGLQTTKSFQPIPQNKNLGDSSGEGEARAESFPESGLRVPTVLKQKVCSETKPCIDSFNNTSKSIFKSKTKKKHVKKKKNVVKKNNRNNLNNKTELCDNVPSQDSSSTTIQIFQNGEEVVVEAASLISVPENEVAFGRDGRKCKVDDPVRFTKGISTPQHAMGTIIIGPGQDKSLSKMKTDTLCFFVVEGLVEITLESAVTTVPSRSYFYVPPQNSYNIKNVSQENSAFLFFSQIKSRSKPKL